MLLTGKMEKRKKKKKDISNVNQTTNSQEKIEDRKNIINIFKIVNIHFLSLTKF